MKTGRNFGVISMVEVNALSSISAFMLLLGNKKGMLQTQPLWKRKTIKQNLNVQL